MSRRNRHAGSRRDELCNAHEASPWISGIAGTWSRIPLCGCRRCPPSRPPWFDPDRRRRSVGARFRESACSLDAGFRAIEAVNSDEALEILKADSEVQFALHGRKPAGNDRRPGARPTGEMTAGRTLASSSFPDGPRRNPTNSLPAAVSTASPTIRSCGQACPRNDGRKTSAAFRAACGIFAKMAWVTDTVVPWGPLKTSTRASSCCASALTMLVPSPAFACAKSSAGFPSHCLQPKAANSFQRRHTRR